jgi:hypothetical protein
MLIQRRESARSPRQTTTCSIRWPHASGGPPLAGQVGPLHESPLEGPVGGDHHSSSTSTVHHPATYRLP